MEALIVCYHCAARNQISSKIQQYQGVVHMFVPSTFQNKLPKTFINRICSFDEPPASSFRNKNMLQGISGDPQP